MRNTGLTRRRPLRRYRELVCFLAAASLFLLVWAVDRGGYTGTRGHRVLIALALLETLSLGALFLLEHVRPRRGMAWRWISLAWACLPAWALVELVTAAALRATA